VSAYEFNLHTGPNRRPVSGIFYTLKIIKYISCKYREERTNYGVKCGDLTARYAKIIEKGKAIPVTGSGGP
jgi:hypothetical protein